MNEFEPILLKKLTYSGEFFGKVMPILEPDFFTDIGNQELFNLIKNHYKEYKSVPTLTELVARVKNVSNSEIRKEIISSLQTINATEEVANVDFMCDETISWVKDAMYMSALQIGSDGLMKKDDSLKLKAQSIMDARAKISIDTDLGIDFDDIDGMISYYSEKNLGIRTQHDELNKRIGGGFLPGTLSIILAAAGIGKSLLMTDLISGIFKNKKNILLVSLEMADKEIMKRVHANAMDLHINSLVDLSKTPAALAKLDRATTSKETIINAFNKFKSTGNTGKLFIKDYPAGTFTPLMLEQLVESYKIEKNITFDMVFVDYIGIMKSDLVTPSAGLYSYIKSIGEEVRASAKKLNLPIISASQLNRSAVGNTSDADNSSVSDSMGTVMTADFMLFLLQDEDMKARKEIVCKVTKNRFNGRTDTWVMGVDYEHMRFHDMLIQDTAEIDDISDTLGIAKTPMDDFGIITAKNAESFASKEISDIRREDIQKVKNDPFKGDDLEDLYKDLGI